MAVYLVKFRDEEFVIEARTQKQAVNWAIGNTWQVKTLTTTELVKLLKDGRQIETVNPEAEAA